MRQKSPPFMRRRLFAAVAVIAAWQFASAVAFAVLGYPIGWVVYSIYTGLYGDVQECYTTYHRAATYTTIIFVTALATAVGVALLFVLERRPTTIRHTSFTFVAWHAATVTALVASEEFGLFWLVHRLDWMIFGAPADLYSFRNVMLPRIIAWVAATTTAIGLVLWIRNKLAPLQMRLPVGPASGLAARSQLGRTATDDNPYAPPQSTQPPT
jgi:hypothetical protein